MKKLFFLLAILIGTSHAFAQDKDSEEKSRTSVDAGNSLLKVNLLSLPLRNFSLAYEHKIGRKVTAGLGVRLMPKGGLPMRNAI